MVTILKRLVTVIPTLIGVVIVTFLLTRVLPGDPAVYFAGPAATPQSIAEIRKTLGLDRPTGSDRNYQPPAGLRRADAAGPVPRDRHRGAARHFRRGQTRLMD